MVASGFNRQVAKIDKWETEWWVVVKTDRDCETWASQMRFP